MSAHSIMGEIAEVGKMIPDPGTGQPIYCKQYLAWIPIVTGSSGETNTLPDPDYAGMELTLFHKTDGGGNRVITASTAINSTGNNTITLGDAGDILELKSVPKAAGTFKWLEIANNGASLSTV